MDWSVLPRALAPVALLLAFAGAGCGSTGASGDDGSVPPADVADPGTPPDPGTDPGPRDAILVDTPDAADLPDLPDQPDLPDPADAPDAADLPDAADADAGPDAADAPDVPDPGPADAPDLPELPPPECAVAGDCDDHLPCTDDWCRGDGTCAHDPIDGPCDDGARCTLDDRCVAGLCIGDPDRCDDRNPCTVDECVPAVGCLHGVLYEGDCDDGNACTQADRCVNGTCRGGAVSCDDRNVCTADRCDPATGCAHDPVEGRCSDGLGCTRNDLCQAGGCTGTPVSCDDGDPCTDDSCAEGLGCTHEHNRAPCDDLSPCTTADTCAWGACAGTPVPCSAPPAAACEAGTATAWSLPGVCEGGECRYQRVDTTCAEGCDNERCAGDPCAGVDCGTPPGPCLAAGRCEGGRCVFAFADGAPCDDGNPCTASDACGSGVCAGAPTLCNRPPAPSCADPSTSRTWKVQGRCETTNGECLYDAVDRACPGGCLDGACTDTIGLLQGEMTLGGAVRLQAQDETQRASVVLPGWLEGAPVTSGTWTAEGGFEP